MYCNDLMQLMHYSVKLKAASKLQFKYTPNLLGALIRLVYG